MGDRYGGGYVVGVWELQPPIVAIFWRLPVRRIVPVLTSQSLAIIGLKCIPPRLPELRVYLVGGRAGGGNLVWDLG